MWPRTMRYCGSASDIRWTRGRYSKSPPSRTDREKLADYRFGDPDLAIAEAQKLVQDG